jgi:hypothetical protein
MGKKQESTYQPVWRKEMNRWWRRKWFSKKNHLKGEDGLGFRV